MDQGLAAVLGALVGALAAGGGTYLTAKSAAALHKRQARREAYRNFLLDIKPLRMRLVELKVVLIKAQDSSLTLPDGALDERLTEIERLSKSLERNVVTVSLEGPSSVAWYAHMTEMYAIKLKGVLFDWWGNLQQSPITKDEDIRAQHLQEKLDTNFDQFHAHAQKYV